MSNPLISSTGLNWLAFVYCDSLQETALVCKNWNNSINQERFLRFYAQSRSKAGISGLRPEFFSKLLPYFHPQQLFHIDGKRMTRHLVHTLSENENNRINLRVVKLIASLDWYQSIIQQNADLCIKQWHSKSPKSAREFRESIDYIHLFVLGTSLSFVHNRADQIKDEVLIQYQSIKLMKRSDLNQLIWYKATSSLEGLISVDYAFLRRADPMLLEQAFQAVFSKYRIKHIMNPRSSERDFLALPTVFFKSLFSALTANFLEKKPEESSTSSTSGESSLKSKGVLQSISRLFFPVTTSSTLKPEDSGFESLSITVEDNEQLCSLKLWLEATKVKVGMLNLNIGFENRDITIESWKIFKENVMQMNVRAIEFFGTPANDELRNLYQEISGILKD